MNTIEQEKQYLMYERQLKELEPLLDTYEFKNTIDEKVRVIGLYLSLSEAQNKIKQHSRTRRMKDKVIREVFDFGKSALELKEKSRLKYERLKNNFNKLFTEKLRKAGVKRKK